MKIGLKVSLLFFFSAFIVSSCSSSSERRVLCVDMRECSDLDDDSRYQMVIYDPNEPASCDTVFWQGDKVIEHKVKLEDCLAFVEVGEQYGQTDYYKTLFMSVVALDGDYVKIKVADDNSVFLSGSQSNELISRFVHGSKAGILSPDLKETDYATRLHDFCVKETELHPNDLYGAFMYSWLVVINVIRGASADGVDWGDNSPAVLAGGWLHEIENSTVYSVSHSVVALWLKSILIVGDIAIQPFDVVASNLSLSSTNELFLLRDLESAKPEPDHRLLQRDSELPEEEFEVIYLR